MATLIAACGLDCAKCDAYIATQANDQAALEQIAAKWRVEYNTPGLVAANILCDSCMAGGRTIGHCTECKIRLCVLERGLENCATCPDYACETLTAFLQNVPQARMNLEAIQKAS
jgi:predicted nucleic acid binding AN1-type Zn finger protein